MSFHVKKLITMAHDEKLVMFTSIGKSTLIFPEGKQKPFCFNYEKLINEQI
jgi:hypothetical protein